MKRCSWATADPLLMEYHDKEWGVPLHEDVELFEFLILEGAQAGLNWLMILKKRENYTRAFNSFDPVKVARYSRSDTKRLLSDPGIIRNRLKIAAVITNAHKFLEVRESSGSFDNYIWQFTSGKPIKHHFRSMSEIPAKSRESDAMSEDLCRRGFKFFGSTIYYAFMQAVGMVNDHTVNCFRYNKV
ncbi:MAG: DNA-3-methyladenine glycosylase I [Candidatus Bathyarchaeia archaeon]